MQLPWIETQVITTEKDLSAVDVNHDLKREMAFYNQARDAVAKGLEQLRELNVPIERPSDYFAEMVKSDQHMEYIRKRLAKQKDRLDRIDIKKKESEARKFGKGKQKLKEQEKQREKKKEMEEIKSWSKKRKTNNQGGDEDDKELEALLAKRPKKTKADLPDSVKFGKQGRGNKKKEYKLSKFAQKAGRKGGWKRNDADSTNAGFFDGPKKKSGGRSKGSKRPNPAARKAKVVQKSAGPKSKKR